MENSIQATEKKADSIVKKQCAEEDHDWSISIMAFEWVGQDNLGRQLAKIELAKQICKKCSAEREPSKQ